jgi:hypothetical protein
MLSLKRVGLALLALVCCCCLWSGSQCQAALIAQDDFESYTAGSTVIGLNGGTGWTSAWGQNNTTTLPITLATQDAISAAYSKSLELGYGGAENRNVIQREFPTQNGTVYLGFVFKTHSGWSSDFFQFYVNANNTTSTSATAGTQDNAFSAGILNEAANRYYVRKGNATGTVGSTNSDGSHNTSVEHTLVVRLSKSLGGAGDIYDEIALWVDQTTQGTPNAILGAGDLGFSSGTTPALGATLSVLHVRLSGQEAGDRAYLDNVRVATSYAEVVPEPSSIGLAMLAASTLLFATRRYQGGSLHR